MLALTKSATVFISYLASTANEQRPSAKTVTPQDVLKALQEMELERVMGLGERNEEGVVVGGRLEKELAVFEEVVKGKRKGYRDKVKARESGVGDETMEGGDGEPQAKRARRGSEEGQDGGDDEQDEEDALLDAQLNGPNGGVDQEEEDEHGDEGDEDEEDEAEDEQQEEAELEDSIDVEDESAGRTRRKSGSKGRSSILAPNGRTEVGSEDDSD